MDKNLHTFFNATNMEHEVIAELIKQSKFIGELMKLINKLGGESIIRELVVSMNQTDYINDWTGIEAEMGMNFLRSKNISKEEALAVIEKAISKYNLSANDLAPIFEKKQRYEAVKALE